jgi:hypothetical protein
VALSAEERKALLTKMHLAVEDELIDRRDRLMSVMGPRNGLIVYNADGTFSTMMRMGTREAMEYALDVVLTELDLK